MTMNNIRLTYLIDNLLRAGTQTALLYLVEGLSRCGYTQRVFCLNRRFDAGVVGELEALGAEVVVLGRKAFLTGSGWRALYRILRKTDIVQTFLPFSDLVGRFGGKLARVPVVVTSIRARNIDKKQWQLFLDRLTMRWADRVVFNTNTVVDYAIAHEGVRPEQVVVIPNGVRFKEPAPRSSPVLKGIVPAGAPVIGAVGRLRPQKGMDVLLDAFARLPDQSVHLVIVGEGELHDSLRARAAAAGLQDRVHFLGARSDVPEMYAAFDIYAHAAYFEGMPNAVMEAMAAGLPVAATRADGTSELIRDGETGWLVPIGDAETLAEKLSAAIGNPDLRRDVGNQAAIFMQEHYSVEKMVNAFDRLYSELIKTSLRK